MSAGYQDSVEALKHSALDLSSTPSKSAIKLRHASDGDGGRGDREVDVDKQKQAKSSKISGRIDTPKKSVAVARPGTTFYRVVVV